MLDLILAVGLLTFAGIALFTPGAWAVKARWLVSIALAGFWLVVLLRMGEVGLVALCALGGLGLMVWGVGLGRWLLGHLRRFWRWRPWWRLLAPYSRGARRRLGGHWEHHALSSGLPGHGGWEWHWRQVAVCHKASPCRFQIAGVQGCGSTCSLVCCEEWDHHVGPGDNIVGEDDPYISLAVQVEEQRQKIEGLFVEAKEALEAREAWQKSGYDKHHWAIDAARWRATGSPSAGGYVGQTLLGAPPGGDPVLREWRSLSALQDARKRLKDLQDWLDQAKMEGGSLT